ncbi:unnamed protein product [Chrysoparadoxa australica]
MRPFVHIPEMGPDPPIICPQDLHSLFIRGLCPDTGLNKKPHPNMVHITNAEQVQGAVLVCVSNISTEGGEC